MPTARAERHASRTATTAIATATARTAPDGTSGSLPSSWVADSPSTAHSANVTSQVSQREAGCSRTCDSAATPTHASAVVLPATT